MKTCTKCGETKPLSDFFARKGAIDGRMSSCKTCKTASTYSWREKNADRWRQYVKLEQSRPHRIAHIASYRASEKGREVSRLHERKQSTKEKRAAYLAANPDRAEAYNANRNARRRSKTLGVGSVGHEEWMAIKRQHGFRCHYCGCSPHRLTRDHYIPLNKGGLHAASNIVPACLSCNSAKRDLLPEEFAAFRRHRGQSAA